VSDEIARDKDGATLERKVGQLTIEIDLLKNAAPATREVRRYIIDRFCIVQAS
jgi:hypothetical protein